MVILAKLLCFKKKKKIYKKLMDLNETLITIMKLDTSYSVLNNQKTSMCTVFIEM